MLTTEICSRVAVCLALGAVGCGAAGVDDPVISSEDPGESLGSAQQKLSGCAQEVLGDFDGDHRIDALCHTGALTKQIRFGSGRVWSGFGGWCSHAGASVHSADFNADGRSDLLCHDTQGSNWVALASFDGTFAATTIAQMTGWCTHSGAQFLAGDFDGDRRADLMCRDASGNTWIAYTDGQDSLNSRSWFGNTGSWCTRSSQHLYPPVQIDGAGGHDMACFDGLSGLWSSVNGDSQGHFNFWLSKTYFRFDEFPSSFKPGVDEFPNYQSPYFPSAYGLKPGVDEFPNSFRVVGVNHPGTLQGVKPGPKRYSASFQSAANRLSSGLFWSGGDDIPND